MKKLLIFLMLAIPLIIIVVLNFTVNSVVGYVSVSVDNIELSETSATGQVGQVYQLDADIYPANATNKNVVWKSDNENVATVDKDGNVSFVGYGKCYIIATTEDGNKKASCYFYIYDTIARELDFYSPKEQISIGESVQLKATIMPVEAENKDIEYFSYDTGVATIDKNGYLTGVNAGYVTVSATAVETGIVSFLSVLVVKPIESFVISSDRVVALNSEYQLKVKTYPLDATEACVFTSSNEAIATVSKKGYVSFLKAGTVDIYVENQAKTIKNTISVTSTMGYLQDIYLQENIINVTLSDAPKYIDVTLSPSEVSLDNIEIKSENPEVCYVDENNYIQYVSTGSAIIRVRGQKSNDEWLEKTILVNISYPAEDILISDTIYSAQNTYKLEPKSYPVISTNQDYFYHVETSDVASVDENGVVTKTCEGICEAIITIYANQDYSSVTKQVKIIFTNDYASIVNFDQSKLDLVVGDKYIPEFLTYPTNSNLKNLSISISNQTKNANTGNVVQIQNNVIYAQFGGFAEITLVATLYDGSKITFTKTIEVIQYSNTIEFNCNLEIDEDMYITGQPTVNFTSKILPEDVSNENISWEILSGPAIIVNNSIKFNSKGTITIVGKAGDGKTTKTVYIKYVGQSPISATLSDVPTTIYVGDTFEVSVLSTFPTNTLLKNITYSIQNQITSSTTSNKVLDIVDGKLKAISGGTCTLTVYVSTSFEQSFEIEVIRIAESIVVYPSNIQTTNQVVSLNATVLPYDTTNKLVSYSVSDSSIATIDENNLIFSQNGTVEITATSLSNSEVIYVFSIEKIDKATSSITPTNKDIKLQVGERSTLKINDFCSSYDSYLIEISNQEIVEINSSNIIIAKKSGNTEMQIYFFDQNGVVIDLYNINVEVIVLVESFSAFIDVDYINGEYQTAQSQVNLVSEVLPTNATNKTLQYEIVESFTNSGELSNSIAYIDGENLNFIQSGIVVMKISTTDGSGLSKLVRIRYTGGNATKVELNYTSTVVLNVGEEITIEATNWIPKNTTNKQIFIEALTQSSNIIEISGKKIKAIAGGTAKVKIEISDGITKTLLITVSKKVEEIKIANDNILTSKSVYTLNATALPSDATNKTLTYEISNTNVATIQDNILTFNKGGSVNVTIRTTDGSNISRNVIVTSTFNCVNNFTLNVQSVDMVKNSQVGLNIIEYTPTDILMDSSKIKYEISSQTSNIQNNQVVSVDENGIIKALCGGVATICVSYTNTDESVIKKYVQVNVYQVLQNISVALSRDVDILSGAYIIGLNKIGFSVSTTPSDATIKTLSIVPSDPEIASIEDNTIIFKKAGKVDIEFTAKDKLDNTIQKVMSFYYTDGKIIEATFDDSDFSANVLTLNAGDKYNFKLKSYIPKDIIDIQFGITEKVETKNHETLSVISFENGQITALAGGTVTLKLNVCSYISSNYKIVVKQPVSSITTETTLYISSADYQLKYEVLPIDATNKEVEFISLNSSLVTVDKYGNVSFNKFGTANIIIKSKENENITRTIHIKYSNEVSVVSFKNIPSDMFVRESLQLTVEWLPYGAEDFSIAYSVSDTNLATVTSAGKLIAGNSSGTITVRAYVVENPNIYCEKTINIHIVISDIELELDSIDDDRGIGGYRVWGDKWFDSKTFNVNNVLSTGIVSTYQMKIKSITPADCQEKLIWTSSNTELATVNENGLVTFVGASGEVTITVQPAVQITTNQELYLKDSYTFTVIPAMNIYTKDELYAWQSFGYNAVLQDNIKYDIVNTLSLQYNLYGNGYILDMSISDYNAGYVRAAVRKSGVVVDNIQMRGASFDQASALSTLEGKGVVLLVESNDKIIENVVIKNTILENGCFCTKVIGAKVQYSGCIMRNSFSAALLIHNNNNGDISIVNCKDCIFKASSLSSILFDPTFGDNSKGHAKLILEGDIKIINWLDIEQISGEGISEALGDATAQLREMVKQNTQLTRNYNGRYYFMAGITAIKAGYEGILTYESFLNVDMTKMSSKYQYVPYTITGAVKLYGVPVNFEMTGYSLPSNSTDILPDTEIEDDPYAYQSIRQPR